ncbi:reticulophagy regulator 3 isoform X2 [Palaemon carinicauda]|uniref:reticulophagy regulator 3 isoform X2 n=1 Tax=Palaemon carinicauda TaxID=392227 RepID=UPI0035B5AD17
MFSWKSAILRLWPFKSENSDPSPAKPDTRKLNRVLGPWEAYMVTLQSILIWERPGTSAVAVVAVNVLFWLLVWSELRILFVMAVTALLVFLHQQWVHSIWPEIRVPRPEPDDSEEWTPVHPSVLSVPEISQYVEGVLEMPQGQLQLAFLHLRRVQPALFCAILSTVLSVFAVMGHLVPGVVLLYVLLMLFMTGPGIVLHVLPDTFFEKIARIRAALRGEDSQMDTSNISMDSDINEFLPELRSAEAQAALDVPLMSQDPPEVEQMVEEAYLQEEEMASTTRKRRKGGKNDEGESLAAEDLSLPLQSADGTTFFASGLPDDFPSYDNESVELDGPDIEIPEVSEIPPLASHSRQGSDHYQMKFVSSHFGDTSEEEDDFTEGLTFEARSEVRPEIRQPQTSIPEEVNPLGQLLMSSMIAQNAGNVLSVLGQNLVTSVIGQSSQSESVSIQQQPRQQPSSSARMTRSYDQQQSVTDLEEDFELISDEEFQ